MENYFPNINYSAATIMSLLKLLKRITQAEMLFCVHRNIHSVKKEYKYIIYLHVILEIIMIVILNSSSLAVTLLYRDGLDIDDKARAIMHFFLISATSVFVIISAIVNSPYSVRFLNYVRHVESNYVNLYELEPFRRKIHYISAYYCLGCFFIVIFKQLPMMLNDDLKHFSFPLKLIFILFNIYTEIRFFTQNVACANSIVAVAGYLHCIIFSMDEIQKYLDYVLIWRLDPYNERRLERFYATYKKRVDIWFRLYSCVVKINYVTKKIYGPHIFNSLCYAQLSVGVMFYQFATTYFVHRYFEIIEWPMAVLVLDSIGIMILLSEGQKVKKSIITIRRNIARIHLTLLKIDNAPDDILKPTAHLYRLMSTEPIAVVVTFSVQIGMSLLPQLIGFATEYVIIALQANSVI